MIDMPGRLFARAGASGLWQILAAHLMLGYFMGFIFFYGIFNYYAAPFDSGLPSWLMVVLLALVGILVGYLFPEPKAAVLSSTVLPVLGAVFCLVLFISPTFSGDITINNISDEFFIMARFLLPYLMLAFIVIFSSSIIMVMLQEEYGSECEKE